MTRLPCRASRGLQGVSNRRFHLGGLSRHVDPVGARLAENMEVNL
jgi:hypothetical protein